MLPPRVRRLLRMTGAAAAVLLLAGCAAPQTPLAPPAPETPLAPPEPPTPPTATSSGSETTVQAVRTTSVPTAAPESTPRATPAPEPTVAGFDRTAHSLDDPTSIWVVVDKRRPLRPRNYVPADLVTPDVPHTNVPQLRRVASNALVRMFTGAKRDGIALVSLSAYRSYASQKSIFDRNRAKLGRATTLELTAKPGYSEHQTGLADDLGDGSSCDLAVCFESHPAATWLAANSWRYGWVLRYPLGFTRITGIQTEPWHFRYIGKAAAKQMHRTGVRTLEQFFGLPASPDY